MLEQGLKLARSIVLNMRLALAIAGAAAVLCAWTESAHAGWHTLGASGTIVCDAPVVGVWVEAGTQSGWASFRRLNSRGTTVTYDRPFRAPSSYRLHVGCGGTPQRWGRRYVAAGTFLPFAHVSYYVLCRSGRCSGVGLL